MNENYDFKKLPEKLRQQSLNVEQDGWLNAARYMNDAADVLDLVIKSGFHFIKVDE